MLNSFELFAGAGGLALGMELAGFHSLGAIEWDRSACATILDNKAHAHPLVKNWIIHCMDVRDFEWSSLCGAVDLLAGGPPCQPFSTGGIGRAHVDMRDMFPAMIRAVQDLRPKVFLVENVKGLLRAQFSDYYQYILLRLEFPERSLLPHENWHDHLLRLQRAKSAGGSMCELTYNVVPALLNSADYGIPQKRERVFIVGFRSDLRAEWSFPEKTHSKNSLLYSKRRGGEYWERHRILPKIPLSQKTSDSWDGLLPWVTVRDALHDLPEPTLEENDVHFNHVLKPGARVYAGHTGSSLDMPSKTLKAGVHGVPGGENMLIKDDGSPRYYTVREAARIQTFPDGYRLNCSWTEAMRQIGNAVPVKLAQIVASSIAEVVLSCKANEIARSANKELRCARREAL